jgi:hypothetical protein
VADIQFLRFDAAGARAQRDTVAAIYEDAYAARIASGASAFDVLILRLPVSE